jgi:hypothetical protein
MIGLLVEEKRGIAGMLIEQQITERRERAAGAVAKIHQQLAPILLRRTPASD